MEVALTFDDGPEPHTAGILDVLEAVGAKASFFIVGDHPPFEGSIVLMHDGRGQTLAALPGIIEGLTERGYRLVTTSWVLRDAARGTPQRAPQTPPTLPAR
jgi:peptidoglycan/xylan/chitin deacetylase (PgdA/CDA1 family)